MTSLLSIAPRSFPLITAGEQRCGCIYPFIVGVCVCVCDGKRSYKTCSHFPFPISKQSKFYLLDKVYILFINRI